MVLKNSQEGAYSLKCHAEFAHEKGKTAAHTAEMQTGGFRKNGSCVAALPGDN